MTATKKVMLLVDADNVSVDVIQQAFDRVMSLHGAAHVRRAYCTAESAAKHLPLFKRLSMRPIVNVSTGKNSTDIALAVDAISLVEAERPDIVVIVSSDSDFAPLVIRLREKGCRVEGIGQKGKTGEDSVVVYDDFIDLEHRKAPGRATAPTRAGARGNPRSSVANRAGNEPRRADRPNARSLASRGRGPRAELADDMQTALPLVAPVAAVVPPPAVVAPMPAPAPSPVAATPATPPARKRGGARKSVRDRDAAPAAAPSDEVELPEPAPARRATHAATHAATPVARTTPAAAATPPPTAGASAAAPVPTGRIPQDVLFILEAVPELAEGSKVELGLAAERLRNVQMLARNAPSTKLFRMHPDYFVLSPERQPNKVEYRGPAPW